MKFSAMLSLLFYKKVVLLFLIPGHSHMIADRVVAWMKNKIRGKNIFHPNQFVDICNSINSVKSSFIDHQICRNQLRIGWDDFLNKYFQNLPGGFTASYFFEFENGYLNYRHFTSTPDSASVAISFCQNQQLLRDVIAQQLFGSLVREEWSMATLSLPYHPGNIMDAKKLKSLRKKYFSIPLDQLPYYPTIPAELSDNSEEESTPEAKKYKKSVKKTLIDLTSHPAKKLGRPKGIIVIPDGQQSILRFLK